MPNVQYRVKAREAEEKIGKYTISFYGMPKECFVKLILVFSFSFKYEHIRLAHSSPVSQNTSPSAILILRKYRWKGYYRILSLVIHFERLSQSNRTQSDLGE